jgi:hypothetical protein
MNYQEYIPVVRQAAELVVRRRYESAIDLFKGLLAEDISANDKAMMCLNMAITYEKLGRPDDVLSWLDRGAEYERHTRGNYVTERKAAYLADQGREQDSLNRYRELLTHAGLSEQDRDRIQANVGFLTLRVNGTDCHSSMFRMADEMSSRGRCL